MAEIRRNWLERAQRELRSIGDRHEGNFKNQDIDWRVIEKQLKRLDAACTEGNESDFNAALEMLVSRLRPPDRFRGQIGPANSNAMPRPIFELLNHVVDRLDYSPPVSNSDGEDGEDQSVVKGDLARGETDVC